MRPFLSAFAFPLILAACGEASDTPAPVPTVTETYTPSPLEQVERGALSFSYDREVLTLVGAEIALPGGDEADVVAVNKLIPADRSEQLGQEACIYGENPDRVMCDPAAEPGLSLALLPEPIETYRELAESSGLEVADAPPAPFGDYPGITYTMQAEGSGAQTTLYDLGDRTLLVQRDFRADIPSDDAAFTAVIETIAIAAAPGDEDTDER